TTLFRSKMHRRDPGWLRPPRNDLLLAPQGGFLLCGGRLTDPGAKHDPWRVTRRPAGLAYELTPQMFAAATCLLGGLMLLAAATPAFNGRLAALGRFYPPLLIDLSHFAASVTGFVLLLISAGLWRRRRGAYYAALGVLLA